MVVVKRKQEMASTDSQKPTRTPTITAHDALVDRADRWLKNACGCSVVLTELRAFTPTGECPDAVGWRSDYSVLVECKVSRSDFLADRKKRFRVTPGAGIGTYRFFMCPAGIIAPEDLPDGWGLLYVEGRKVEQIVGPKGNSWSYGENQGFRQARNPDAEIAMLVSALRRKG